MANRYWVGGTANWDTTAGTKWALTSGGAGGEAVPTTSDDVFFDAASGAVTVSLPGLTYCQNLTFTGFTGTIASTGVLSIYGSFVGASGMSWTMTGTLIFTGDGATTLTSNGVAFTSTQLKFSNQTSFTLLDDFTFKGETLSLSASSVFNANGKTVTFTSSAIQIITGAFSGANSFYNLTFKPAVAGKGRNLQLSSNITVANALVIDSNSTLATYRALLGSSVMGTSRTITCNGSVTASAADVADIVAAGSASWDISAATGGSGDLGGNSGITFTTAATQYFKASSSQSWSAPGNWYLGSNGTGGAGRVPLAQDTARFDSASIGAASVTIAADVPRCGSVDWSGVTNTPTWADGSSALSCYGSITLASAMTSSGSTAVTFAGRGSNTLNTSGVTFRPLVVAPISGTLTLAGNYTCSANAGIVHSGGTFSDGGYAVTVVSFTCSSGVRTLNRTGLWTLTVGSVNPWTLLSNSLTLSANTGSIKFTGAMSVYKVFAGGGVSYGDIWFSTTGSSGVRLSGSNTFVDFKASAGTNISFTAGITTTATTWTVSGASGSLVTLSSSSTSAYTLAKAGGGVVSADYMGISRSTASPAATFYAGTHSTDGGNNTNWTFTAPPASAGVNNLFFGSNF